MRKWIIVFAALTLAVGVGWYALSDSVDPAALTDLDAESFNDLRDGFNRAAGDVRVVVLLSPT
jgi:hypothetical protein